MDTATAAELRRLSELIRGATARVAHVLVIHAHMGPYERRQLEDAVQDLGYAVEYLRGQTASDISETD